MTEKEFTEAEIIRSVQLTLKRENQTVKLRMLADTLKFRLNVKRLRSITEEHLAAVDLY